MKSSTGDNTFEKSFTLSSMLCHQKLEASLFREY